MTWRQDLRKLLHNRYAASFVENGSTHALGQACGRHALPIRKKPEMLGFDTQEALKNTLGVLFAQHCGADMQYIFATLHEHGLGGYNHAYLGAIKTLAANKIIISDMSENSQPLPWRLSAKTLAKFKPKPKRKPKR